VRLIVERKFGQMICYTPHEMGSVPLIEAVNKLRTVDPEGDTVQTARALGISFGDCAAGESPFAWCVEEAAAATAEDVELDAEFTLDLADAAADEALA
jgi:6-phosphofructokinase 1